MYQNILIFSSTCEIYRPFWNPQAYYPVHRSSQLVSVLSQMRTDLNLPKEHLKFSLLHKKKHKKYLLNVVWEVIAVFFP